MRGKRRRAGTSDPFAIVRTVGLAMPGVETAVKYDGSPRLTLRGCFMAGVATHPSAEPATLVVRCDVEDRAWLLDEAPETYYLTGYYEKYPLVLARLSRLDQSALRDLLATSHRLTLAKSHGHRVRQPRV